jgi:hypothetical protein
VKGTRAKALALRMRSCFFAYFYLSRQVGKRLIRKVTGRCNGDTGGLGKQAPNKGQKPNGETFPDRGENGCA